jgi:hypothetical protein
LRTIFAPLAIGFAALACLALPAAAAGYLYGINATGKTTVNGSQIDNLPSDYDIDYPFYDTKEAWRDIVVVDGDRYALRGNGLVMRNGEKLWSLDFDSDSAWFWTELEEWDGNFYALRQNGNLAVNGEVEANLPRNDFLFTSLVVVDGATYALRCDGSIFKNGGSEPIFMFRAGDGIWDSGDGREIDTLWVALKVDPSGDWLYALRSDGVMRRGELPSGDEEGEYVDSFPFPGASSNFSYGNLYWDFELEAPGRWVVASGNGMVYRYPDSLTERVNLPGNGVDQGEVFLDVALFDGRFFVLRSDGAVYVEGLEDPIVKLDGSGYGRMEISTLPPNLASSENNAPAVALYTVVANTGEPVKVPVIATDLETPADELTVTPEETPPGSVWDAGARTLTLTAPAEKGNLTFSCVVDDGDGSAKTYTCKIQVKAPDADPLKNKAPYRPKIKKVVALVGVELRLYIPLADPDGDPVSVVVNPLVYPFSAGARYEPSTSEFVWTPTVLDLGKPTIEFVLDDGTTTATLKLKLEVMNPLFVPEPLP